MIEAGIYHNLTVNRVSDYGLYLADLEGNEVLLPNRYVSLDDKVGDSMEVFVYHDSEDRLVASTEKPFAIVDEVAFLEVVDKTIHGVFLDWGLSAKHLFMPNRNMIGRVEPGQKYVVYIYCDDKSGRAVATMSLKKYISNVVVGVKLKEEVDIIMAVETPLGFRVVINNLYWGMVYSNQLFKPVALGEKMKGYIRKIAEDNRIDVSLQLEGYDEVKKSADKLLEMLRANNGTLPVNDNSTPEEIKAVTSMSKKVFKRAVGSLLKKGVLTIDEQGLKVND